MSRNRRFLHRAVTYLVKEASIRRLLDIGTGIPAPPAYGLTRP